MSNHDYIDDFMMMKMIEEDEKANSGRTSVRSLDTGYLPVVVIAIALFLVAKLLI